MDCADGEFCLSGSCATCTEDRRCGVRCTSCGDNTPYCFADRTPDAATCVRCLNDDQCAGGGKCNLETHECDKGCAMSCAPEAPYCDGQKCVECYADTQCPCGGTCDLTNNTCSPSCKSNVDCLGHEHCKWKNELEKDCAPGPMQPVECGGTLDKLIGQQTSALKTAESPEICGADHAGSCAASGGDRRGELPAAGIFGLLSLALFGIRGVRRGRGRS
jgi:Cys-rich repeat protein